MDRAKTVIVTGAGSGIGRATAMAFLRDGYNVALAGRRVERLENTLRDSGAPASRALIAPTNVADPEAVRSLFSRTKQTFARLDVLFNNAGVFGPGVLLEDVPLEQW